MEEKTEITGVRQRLILSALHELEEYGLRNFSLRRVAEAADVSCAAPYRHFKDKEELILAVIAYVREGWELLCEDIFRLYPEDKRAALISISVAAVRFWIANGGFRSVLMATGDDLSDSFRDAVARFDEPVKRAVDAYCQEGKGDPLLSFTVLSLIYGSVSLISGGKESIDSVISMLLSKLHRELSDK